MLVLRNRDVPGVVGQVGTALGRHAVNIAGIQLGRPKGGEKAISILNVDSAVPAEALEEIRSAEQVLSVRAVSI